MSHAAIFDRALLLADDLLDAEYKLALSRSSPPALFSLTKEEQEARQTGMAAAQQDSQEQEQEQEQAVSSATPQQQQQLDDAQPSAAAPDPTLYMEQLRLETQSVDTAVTRYRKLLSSLNEMGRGASMRASQRVLLSWFKPLVDAIENEQQCIRAGVPGEGRKEYGPHLLQMASSELACIAMHELVNQVLRDSRTKFSTAAIQIGRTVNAEMNLSRLKSNKRQWTSMLARWRAEDRRVDVPFINQQANRRHQDSLWSAEMCAKVGAALLKQLLDVAKIEVPVMDEAGHYEMELVDAFKHDVVYDEHDPDEQTRNGPTKRRGWIEAHPQLLETIEQGHALVENLHPQYLPMLVPPRPWTSFEDGGYLTLRGVMMRTKHEPLQLDVLRRGDLADVLDGLNAVAQVPWRINRDVYGVMKTIWESGGGVGELPPRSNVQNPVPPMTLPADDAAGWREYRKELRAAERQNRNLHSLRCDAMLKMDVAEMFQERERIYMPHNIDFRGRAYPIPPHLSHVGPDMARGMLLFADGKPLGEEGMRWLKIHFANLCGHDKVSFDDRVLYAEERVEDILAVASDPLLNDWWKEAENPWQVLATCFELSNAISSGNPEGYVSRLPVHQDGTCNGLQHYAALSRDAWGGAAVNLVPATKPQDVYTGVCDLVNERVEADAAQGVREAKMLKGHVNRKVVKQTVMTSVYGVTFVGARQQIFNRLQDIWPNNDREENRKCALYLARVTMGCLSNMFSDARKIMDWLGTCAQVIAEQGQCVAWTTPLSLPVVQPYRRSERYQVKTIMQTVTLVDDQSILPVSKNRQRSAFPPNFVHSLDSTHMLMTALECRDLDITFAAVHDSFWTHACTVDTMNESLRRQFIQLYKRPILEDLNASFHRRFPGTKFPKLPPRGTLDIDSVMSSPYFFS